MNIKTLLVFLLTLLLLTLFIAKAEAEAPMPVITIPESISNDPIKAYAYQRIAISFNETQWSSFNNLITKESRWRCNAQNPNSSAYGLGQLLNSTWKLTNYEKSSDCYKQIEATIEYVRDTYKNPDNAWSYWQKNQNY